MQPCQHPPSAPSRRRALLLAAPAAAAAALTTAARAAAAAAAAGADDEEDAAASFYQRWPYQRPADILPFVRARAARGDAGAVLAALEEFAERFPMYAIGPAKGALVDGVLAELRPTAALEVGTFLGYSAVRTARQLVPGGLLVCIGGSFARPCARLCAWACAPHRTPPAARRTGCPRPRFWGTRAW